MPVNQIQNTGSNLKPATHDGIPLKQGDITAVSQPQNLMDLIRAQEPNAGKSRFSYLVLRPYGTVYFKSDGTDPAVGSGLYWTSANAPMICRAHVEKIKIVGEDAKIAFGLFEV